MDQPRVSRIDSNTGLVLDTFRIFAALVVLTIHACDQWLTAAVSGQATNRSDWSHGAVIVFFVISGYVISSTTQGKSSNTLSKYAQNRLSRLYSAFLPALVITAICAFILNTIAPALLAEYSRGASLPRYLLTAVFGNEVWFLSAAPPLNRPLWSLSYEFWYYAIFGLWYYRANNKRALLLPLLACIVAGPKILLLFPIWLAGCLANKLRKPQFSVWLSMLLSGISFIAAFLCILYLPKYPYVLGNPPFYYANQFVTDTIGGLFFAAGIALIPTGNNVSGSLMKVVRRLADLTFPIYVLHHPLLILWRGIFGFQQNNVLQMVTALLVVLVVCCLIGIIIEKQLPLWKRFFNWLFTMLQPHSHLNGAIINGTVAAASSAGKSTPLVAKHKTL